MFRSTLLCSIIAFSTLATSIPVNNDSAPSSLSKRSLQDPVLQKRTFSVIQTQNAAEQFDGAYALKKAYLKHGLPVPASLQKRQLTYPQSSTVGNQGGATGNVIAVSEANDLEYVSPVSVGGTMMRLDFDTGSSDLYVPTPHITKLTISAGSSATASQQPSANPTTTTSPNPPTPPAPPPT
jgi:hypothetical protein